MEVSKTQIDRLGERLRKGNITDDDLRLLDDYRRSFVGAHDAVVERIRQELALEPTGRPAKSTTSIAEKLRRESIRLTQIQDIAGCRLVVPEVADQERILAALLKVFPKSTVIDRRQKPSHGYRAVHVIASLNSKAVEIQIRTALQQVWAELSEKLSDLSDPAIKYGGGNEDTKELLAEVSVTIAEAEDLESSALEIQADADDLASSERLTEDARKATIQFQTAFDVHKANVAAAREDTLQVIRHLAKRFEE